MKLTDNEKIRLQKVLAAAGFGSRRACEQLMASGRVSVDGHVVREMGTRVDPSAVVLHVDGLRVQLDDTKVTVAVNKPRGMLSAMSDDRGRPTLADIVSDRPERLFHVGRLDAETQGLILLTNDGDLGHRLAHPSYEVKKTYLATLKGRLTKSRQRQLREGITLEDGDVTVHEFRVVDERPGKSLVEITIHEGRNHIVRRVFDHVGHPVTRLVRTAMGSIRLGDLPPRTYRVIGGEELGKLMQEVDL